jgi:hypothetical protein
MTSAITSALDEVIEGYAETTKVLVEKWREYASEVGDKLDDGYDADSAAEDFGTAISLAIETAARLTWEAMDAMATLVDAPTRPRWVEYPREFSSPLKGAKLELAGDLKNAPGQTLAARDVRIIPPRLGPGETEFKLQVNIAGYPAGVYRGKVVASTQHDTEKVRIQVQVP